MQRSGTDNIIYFMGPYSHFDFDKAPFIVVHDLQDGLYMFDMKTKQKTSILGHYNCKFEKERTHIFEP
jgi:hypothetical protein